MSRIIYLGALLMTMMVSEAKTIRLAFSKCSGGPKYERYAQWVKSHYPDAECIDMYRLAVTDQEGKKVVHPERALEILRTCDGLIMTGGPDIDPGRYGKQNDSDRCEIQAERDTLEFALYREAQKLGLPVLAICRGMQLVNVAEGGSLYTDIPTDIGKQVIHRTDTGALHRVKLTSGTFIYQVCGMEQGTINSFHHQSVDRVGQGLIVTGRAEDGVAEVLERKSGTQQSWLLGVQWHPERLPEHSPFSENILRVFVSEVEKFSQTH